MKTLENLNQNKRPAGCVVGIGASAGGLEPVKAFVKQIQKGRDEEHAFLLIIHQNDRFESHLLEILTPECALPMKWAEEGETIEAGKFYLCPAKHDVWIQDGKVVFDKGQRSIPGPSIDRLILSLAVCYQDQAVAVILSGSGHDGASGSCSVAQAGGMVFTQLPEEAQYPQMPEACLRKCPEAVAVAAQSLMSEINIRQKQFKNPDNDSTLEQLKRYTAQQLKVNWRISISWFRPSWLDRCWSTAQSLAGSDDWNEIPVSKEHRETFAQLAISYLLEHQDSFFFSHPLYPNFKQWIENRIHPHNKEKTLRIWVPFAGTGEFAFSISLCIQALLDKLGIYTQVQIFTSDLSEEKIDFARKGIFSREQIEAQVPIEFHNYFKPIGNNDKWEIAQEVKSKIIFSPHNPFSDPPFLHLDLITSGSFFNRLNQEARMRIRDIFAFSLKKEGCLIVEDANWLDFSPGPFINKKELPHLFNIDPLYTQSYYSSKPVKREKESWFNQLIHQISNHQHNQEKIQPAAIPEKHFVIIDKAFNMKYLSDGISPLFHLPNGSLNQSIFSYLDEKLETEIKAQIAGFENANLSSKPTFRKLKLNDGQTYFVRVRIGLPPSKSTKEDAYLLAFDLIPEEEILATQHEEKWAEKVGEHEYKSEIRALKIRLAKAEEELNNATSQQLTLQEELQNTYSSMQQIQEQLAGSNEELASSNEELKVAYQELKSIYTELKIKEQKLELAHTRLQDLISNSFQPYLQISRQYIVELFNSKAADIFKECTNSTLEIGKSLLHNLKGESLQKFLKYVKTVNSGHAERGEFVISDLSGRNRHFYFTATPLFNEHNEVEHILFNFLDFSDLTEIKEELEERNQLIENVFKVVDVGLIITDANGLIITCNDAAANLLDLSREELIGQNQSKFVKLHKLDNLIIDTNNQEGKKNLFELTLNDGKYKLVQATTRDIELQDDSMQVLSLLDITDKIKYLNLLEDTQTAAHVGGWDYDISNNKFEITEEVKRILPSITIGDLNLENAIDLLSPDSKYKFEKQLPALLNGLIIIEEDIQIDLNNETQIWLHIVAKPFMVNGKVRKIIGTVQDITEKKLSELELKKLSLVASKTHNAVIITNNNQEIEWVNEGFEKLTGYSSDEVLGKNPKILQGKDTDPEAIRRISEKLAKKEPLTETILNYHKNGTPYWIELTITPVLNKKGEIEKFISIEADVTNEKNIENQQKHLLRELTRQNQELLRFSYITSHNLRAPLANILGLLNLFDRNHLPTQEDQFVLDSLFESANTLNNTLQDLVESLHHKTEGEKAKSLLSLEDTWENVKRLFTNQLHDANTSIQVNFEACPFVLWNKNYLNSVLQNLFSNSIKYRKLDQPLEISISMEVISDEPVLKFTDNGQGFDAERYQDRLFGLYQRFNTEVEGKGLGLFIVNSQVKSMGGHIEVWSKPDEGAQFIIHLGKNAIPQNAISNL